MSVVEKQKESYSIGDIARISGISENVLRVWEHRYGKPVPFKLPSGHRRYSGEQLNWLLEVAELLSLGIKTSQAVKASAEERDQYLQLNQQDFKESTKAMDQVVEALLKYDSIQLDQILKQEWKRLEPIEFFDDFLTPLLMTVGHCWQKRVIGVRHEHFFSDGLMAFFKLLRVNKKVSPSTSPVMLMATLENDGHGFGLQMASVIARLNGYRVIMLGVCTPLEEVIAAANELPHATVAVSVSSTTVLKTLDRLIKELRENIPEKQELIVGCKNSMINRKAKKGVNVIKNMTEFQAYLHSAVLS